MRFYELFLSVIFQYKQLISSSLSTFQQLFSGCAMMMKFLIVTMLTEEWKLTLVTVRETVKLIHFVIC